MSNKEKKILLSYGTYMPLARFLALERWERQVRFTEDEFANQLLEVIEKPETLEEITTFSRYLEILTELVELNLLDYGNGIYYPKSFDNDKFKEMKQSLLKRGF